MTFDTTPLIAVDADENGQFRADGVTLDQTTVRGYALDYVTLDMTLPPGVTRLTLKLASGFVEEVVVVGRATEVARKNLANSVATVKAEELNRAPAQTVDRRCRARWPAPTSRPTPARPAAACSCGCAASPPSTAAPRRSTSSTASSSATWPSPPASTR